MVRKSEKFKFHKVVLISFLLQLSTFSAAETVPTLTLNDTNEPPYTTKNRDGILDLITTEAFRRAGVKLRLIKLPAERALINANAGIEDGDLVRIAGLEQLYPNLRRIPEKLIDWEFAAFSKISSLESNWDNLKNHVIGYITGWKIYEQKARDAKQVVTTKGPEQLFYLLSKNRIDVALYTRWMGQAFIRRMKLENIYQSEPLLARRKMYTYLNNKHSEYIPRIATALRELKEEGFYQSVINEKLNPYKEMVCCD